MSQQTKKPEEVNIVDEYNRLVQERIPWKKLEGPFMKDVGELVREVVTFVGVVVSRVRSAEKRLAALEKGSTSSEDAKG